MAAVKFLNAAGKYDDPAVREDVIRYITQKVKTPSVYIGACGVDIPYAVHEDTYNIHIHFVFISQKGRNTYTHVLPEMGEDASSKLNQSLFSGDVSITHPPVTI